MQNKKTFHIDFTNKQTLLTFGCFVLVFVTYITGFFNYLIDFDAPQYANIAKDMVSSKSYLQLFDRGRAYLDKPPLVFWTSAIFYKILGINDFAYRLPSFLVSLLGLYSLYRFSLLYYSHKVAITASLIAASCQAFFLMHHDVRTDTMLTGFLMFSFWQLSAFMQTGKLKHIVWGAIGVGLSMLSKGPIGIMVPIIAYGSHFLFQRNLKAILKWQYLLALGIIAIVLAPMTYGLYQQFDMHPQSIYYQDNVSGVKFFYWTQSFGRIFGDNPIPTNNPDPFFLYHSLLWSLLPWSLIFVVAIVFDVKSKIKAFKTNYKNVEIISTAGFIITLVMMSLSTYQLPHYTFVVHPFASLIIAQFMINALPQLSWKKIFIYLSVLIWVLCLLLSFYIMFLAFNTSWFIIAITYLFFIVSIIALFKLQQDITSRIIVSGVLVICGANFMVNFALYKPCFKYQSDSEIALHLNKEKVTQYYVYNTEVTCSGYFYFNGKINEVGDIKEITLNKPLVSGWIMTDSIGKSQLDSLYTFKENKLFYDYPISGLSGEFINPNTRLSQCKKNYLLKLEKK